MPIYSYQAFDISRKKHKGLIEASSENEAKRKLREQGILVSKLALNKKSKSKENLKGEQLLTFTLQLSYLVNAGIPVYESLLALEEQYRKESFARILLSLCDQIKAGSRLSEAMGQYPDSFNQLFCSMIAAGESAGALDVVLEKLAELLAKQNKLKREIASALIYPGILMVFSFLVISLLLGYVVPSIESIFVGRELNSFTQFILNLSHIFRNYWWIYLPIISLIIIWVFFKIRTLEGKLWLERNLLKLPLLRTMLIQAAIARFCRTMGTLQKGGLTIIDSLRIARDVMGNKTLEEEIKRAEGRIIEGSTLSIELSKSRWVPHMVSRMLAVGEDSGTSLMMFNKIADMYEENLEKTVNRLLAFAQPVILIVMGFVIGAVLLAILLPLTDMSSFAM
jgi:general secretion pathway protein F